MKALVIEDETIARNLLVSAIEKLFPDIEIIKTASSVTESINFLNQSTPQPDIIFMDVILSDGTCFDIFRNTTIKSHVIVTTAYDKYAIDAFEKNCIDYLLKPIKEDNLKRAVERCRKDNLKQHTIQKLLETDIIEGRNYQESIIIHTNSRVCSLKVEDIAYFFSENKDSFAVSKLGEKICFSETLDFIMSSVNPNKFFRASRGLIISKDVVNCITKSLNGQLHLSISHPLKDENNIYCKLIVSRARAKNFLSWISN